MNFFEVFSNLNNNKKNLAFTVIKGEGLGEKAIFSDNLPIFADEKGFFSAHCDEIKKINESGLFEIEDSLIYSEIAGRRKNLIICGAGHVSIPIIKIAKIIGFNVTVIDDRNFFAENAKKAGADFVICGNFSDSLSKISSDSDTYFVIVTRGHSYDSECLRIILKKTSAYVGMMGSKRRVEIVKETLINDGYNYDDVMNLHAPIGLSINAGTPEEIAISIMAEIIEIKNQSKNIEFPAEILKYILENENSKKILCTIVSKHGAGPRNAGTKMLCTDTGKIIGTIGGGLMEATVIKKADEIFKEKTSAPVLMKIELNSTQASKEGEVCGGVLEIFLERV